jgi:hypothetical protein
MRLGALIVVAAGAASVVFGLSNIWIRREGVTPRGRIAIIVVPIMLGLTIAGGSVVLALGPGDRNVLADAPGRDVVYRGGRLLDTSVVRGIAGAPSYVARFYGTDESDEVIVANLAGQLTPLGFSPVPGSPGPIFRPGDGHPLAAFANGRTMVRLHSLAVPRRIGGLIVAGVRQILVVVVSDDGKPSP